MSDITNGGSQSGVSAVGQTANIGRSTSVSSGAAKVFREFKWGLLTLFLLMVVVVGLVYDGGKRKQRPETDPAKLPALPEIALDGGMDAPILPPEAPVNGAPMPGALVPSQPERTTAAPIIENPNLPTPGAPVTEQGLGQAQPAPVAAIPVAPAQPVSAPATATPADSKSYVVKNGDTLTKIASTMLPGKGGMKAILQANKDVLPDPNKLKVGMTLKIPAAVAASETKPKPAATSATVVSAPAVPAAAPKLEPTEYVVQSGDTLERIARKVLNDGRRWKELHEWNRDQLSDPSRLHIGQTLKLKISQKSARAEAEIEQTQPAKAAAASVSQSERTEEVKSEIRVMSSAANLP